MSPQVWRGYLQRKRTLQDRKTEMEFIGMVSPSLASAWGSPLIFVPPCPHPRGQPPTAARCPHHPLLDGEQAGVEVGGEGPFRL